VGSTVRLARLGPLWPYVVLTAIPAAGFIVPDLIGGHLLMTGDNLQQNYPLHVLVGSMVRHGVLPFWNQYIFSGTPLLAGFNAGAFYPLVGLFVILPDRVAWIATEVILYSLIAIGMYVFLRALALSTTAGVLAAITFAFSGVVLSQVNHVDMTEGFVAIPWMLLAVLHIVRDGRWRWAVLLGVGFALVILGGAPEAMLDEALLVIAYAVISAGIDRGRWWRVLTRCGAGAALALSLAAIQWLPGLSAIAASQRSGLGGSFAASGSYPPSYGVLSLVPYLFGGYGTLGERSFFAGYNLPEVEIYLGILPIIALVTMWHPRWPSRLAHRERLTWYAVGLLGVLLALGPHTPLEHLFNALPLYGHQRLQSRNMIIASVAVCVLFAGWIDRKKDHDTEYVRFDRLVALIPFAVVLALVGWAVFDPDSIITTLTSVSVSPAKVDTVREATLIALAFCLTAVVIVWLRANVGGRRWLIAVAVFTVVDLGLVAGTSQLIQTPDNAVLAGSTPVERYVAAHLAPGGRFTVYDPQLYSNGSFLDTGYPDVNVLSQLPSVAGYASIVNARYNSLTLTHTQGELDVPKLAAGELDELDLQDIVTAPEYFLLPLSFIPPGLDQVQQVSEEPGSDPVLPMGSRAYYKDPSYRYYPTPRGALRAGQVSAWFFGESLRPAGATVLLGGGASAASIRFGAVGATGAIRWGAPVPVSPGVESISGQVPPGAAFGLAVQVVSGRLPPHQADITVGPRTYELDGSLSAAVRPGTWHQAGSVEGYSLFLRDAPPTPVHTVAPSGRPGLPVDVVSNGANAETVRFHATGTTTVVRDVAWDAGWRASVAVDGGAPREVAVARHGGVQQVRVPGGDDVVAFSYRPPHLVVAAALSGAALLVLLVLLVAAIFRRYRRRNSSPGPEPEPEPA
jgi:hypothetical protein